MLSEIFKGGIILIFRKFSLLNQIILEKVYARTSLEQFVKTHSPFNISDTFRNKLDVDTKYFYLLYKLSETM